MILAAAYTLISLVVIVACLRVLRLPPFTRPALHAAPRHRGHADVWDDEPVAPGQWFPGDDDSEPVSQQDIDERDGRLERGLGLDDERQGEYGAETSRTCCASFPGGPHLACCLPDEPWAPLLRTHLDADGAPPLTEAELARIAERFRQAQREPVRFLPETPAYRPPPVDRAPRVTAGRHAANRSAGREGPRMLPLNGRDERDFPWLARTWKHETDTFLAIGPEAAHG